MKQEAIFAAGCFWGVEEAFRTLPGVLETEVGYTGGHIENPTYEDICGKKTGHAEAVRIVFNPEEITYEALVHEFYDTHDPTQVNRQGPDVGEQYRSAIFFKDEIQQEIAERITKELNETKFENHIATEITRASTFYKAEDYHQQYFMKRGGGGVCHS